MALSPDQRRVVAEMQESSWFSVVRPFCADTKEKRDWPELADWQAAMIVRAIENGRAGLTRLTEAEREGLIEAIQAGTEVDYVETLIEPRKRSGKSEGGEG